MKKGLRPNLRGVGACEVLDALADGAYITDTNRKIVFWSRAAQDITGWRTEDVVGHSCSDNILVHVDKDGHKLCGEEFCPLHRAMLTGEQSQEPLLVFAQHKQGHRIPVEVSVAPLRGKTGAIEGGIEVFRDLTAIVKDLQRAQIIQQHVLELRVPDDERVRFEVSYRPEDLVGGDFYSIQALDQGRYAIMVADVMGHGVAAALYTMHLRSIWDDCQDLLGSPDAFLRELNTRLHKLAQPDGYFATALFLLLDPGRSSLHCIRAGHPAPLLFHHGQCVREPFKVSPALGLRSDVLFTENTIPVAPGDCLLLFTDGAIEISDAYGRELGESGLLRLVLEGEKPNLDLARIEKRLLEFSNQIRLPDDLTLLSIQLLR
jgi:phosphoserine phosphatase RsbU/P